MDMGDAEEALLAGGTAGAGLAGAGAGAAQQRRPRSARACSSASDLEKTA